MSDTVKLMVVAPCRSDTIAPLTDALKRFAPACVLIAPANWQPSAHRDSDAVSTEPEALDQELCRTLVELIQSHEIAAIVANDAAMAAATEADGCHIDTVPNLEERFDSTRKFLGSNAIVGAMPGTTRHMAMALAEAGADYVGYAVDGSDNISGLELMAWWAEIFESPVVAFTNGDLTTCRRAIEAGPPDFISCPLVVHGAIEHLQGLSHLIDEIGLLPIAKTDAK